MKLVNSKVMLIDPPRESDVYKKIELCGRVAYKSEGRITDTSAIPFIYSLIKRGHESVLEHVSVTARIITDRATANALVRHRIAAYTQESTIYCDYEGEVAYRKPFFLTDPKALLVWQNAMEEAERAYEALRELGVAPGIARDVLPNATKTELIATYDLRMWRHVIKTRSVQGDSYGMHLVMAGLLDTLSSHYPVIFDDIDYSPALKKAIAMEVEYDNNR